jgi:hypothetical protein
VKTHLFSPLLHRLPYAARVQALGPLAYFPLWEASGNRAYDLSGNTADTGELLANPGFETAGGGGVDVLAGWSEQAGDGTIARSISAGEFRSGAAALKHTAGAIFNGFFYQNVGSIVPGNRYRLSFWTRGDGGSAGGYAIRDVTNGAYLPGRTSTGVTGTAFQQVTVEFNAPAGCRSIAVYLYTPTAAGGFACYDDVSLSGVDNPFSAWYGDGTNYLPALAQPGMGDGKSAPYFNGSAFVDIYSPALAAAFDGNTLTISAWAKAGFDWGDAAANDIHSLYVDGNNQVHMFKGGANAFYWRHIGSATTGLRGDLAASYSGWQHYAQVIEAGVMKAYRNGALVGAEVGGLGVFSGSLAPSGVKIGNAAQSTPFHAWVGWIAHYAIFNQALSAAQIGALARR